MSFATPFTPDGKPTAFHLSEPRAASAISASVRACGPASFTPILEEATRMPLAQSHTGHHRGGTGTGRTENPQVRAEGSRNFRVGKVHGDPGTPPRRGVNDGATGMPRIARATRRPEYGRSREVQTVSVPPRLC